MKNITAILSLALIFISAAAFAEKQAGPNDARPEGVLEKKVTIPKASSSLMLGLKSWEDSGRAADLSKDDARVAKSKNEFYAGYRFTSGWGAYLQGVQYYNVYKNNTQKTKWSEGDASVTLLHPDLYSSPNLMVFGQFRGYIPTTDRSQQKNIHQFAYYLRENIFLGSGHEIYNESVPRYFDSKNYSASDTTYYLEDTTIYNYKLSKQWKIGAKSWAQYEVHSATRPGFSLEMGPQAAYAFNSNFSISPSLSFPVAIKNSVYDGPHAVATDQAYFDIFLQAKL